MIVQDFFSAQFLRFLTAGGFAAVVNFAVGYSLAGQLPFHSDIVAGHLSGMVVAFFLFERDVFGRAEGSRSREVLVFLLVNGLAVLQTWIVYILLRQKLFPAIDFHFHPAELSRVCAIAVPVFTSFLGHKYFTFRHPSSIHT